MKTKLISIIIPVFNAEAYIDECIKSIIYQNVDDIEIIVIDDGSTDSSLEKCLFYQKIDNRIKVYHFENEGVSHARNLGIERANGKWIMFLDSDDYLMKNCLEKIINIISDEVEEICANYTNINAINDSNNNQKIDASKLWKMTLDPINNNLLPSFFEVKDSTLMSSCGKLFLRKVLLENNIRFDENLKLSEDMLFHLNYLKHIKNVLLTDLIIFNYRNNDMSATHNFKEDYLINRIYLCEILKEINTEGQFHCAYILFQFLYDMEKSLTGRNRKEIEIKIIEYINENNNLFHNIKNKKISRGRWQNMIFKICNYFIVHKCYELSFLLMRIYANLR